MSTDQPSDREARDATSHRDAAGSGAEEPTLGHDPLRRSRTSGTWIAVVVLALLLLLLAVFILQNTQKVEVAFFGWNGQPRSPRPCSSPLRAAHSRSRVLVCSESFSFAEG